MEQLKPITFYENAWHDGNVPIIGPLSHGSWMGSPVFDGARSFNGCAPDLVKHLQRLIQSSKSMLMSPPITEEKLLDIAIEGIKQFDPRDVLYIRPMIWAEDSMGLLRCDPGSSRFCVTVVNMPFPEDYSFSACISSFVRPLKNSAPTDAKAACLYPNGARAMQEASELGFDNAVMLDPFDGVAEFCSANLFLVKDGVLITPELNGTFLAGITRYRTIRIALEHNIVVEQRKVTVSELFTADEIFSTGNYAKLSYLNRLEDYKLPEGQMFKFLREKYFEFSESEKISC